MAARMKAYRDARDGLLHPEQDHREVPASVMAEYLGIAVRTFHDRWVAGWYPRAGARMQGRYTYFRPRVIMGIEAAPSALRA